MNNGNVLSEVEASHSYSELLSATKSGIPDK